MATPKVTNKKSFFKGAVLENQQTPLKIFSDIEVPKLNRGQVLVKLAYSGVCHSQVMEINGFRGEDKYLPHLLGHEGSGVVLAVGKGVRKVKINDRIVLGWIKGKGIEAGGSSFTCKNLKINAGGVTTFNEMSVVSENRCVIVPKGVPMDVAALFGCAILTGSGIVTNTIKPKKNSTIAFFGMGGIGMSALIASNLYNLKEVIAVDINNKRLDLAQQFGAKITINSNSEDPVERIKEITNGRGVDYAIDAAGIVKTIEQAFESVKINGGLAVFASHPKYGEKIAIDPFDLISGKRILGSWGGGANPDKDIPIFASLYLDGILPFQKLITKKYKLNQINQAIKDLQSGKVLRPIISIDPSIKNTGKR